jgi:chromosome segregation ATPase
MGKMLNSVFLFLLVVLVVLVLSGYLVREVMDLHQKNDDKDEQIADMEARLTQLRQTIDEMTRQIGELQTQLEAERAVRQTEQEKINALTSLLEAKQLELMAKDAELAIARQERYEVLAELEATKLNWQKTTVALIETWQDYEQAQNELAESQAIINVAIRELEKVGQERDALQRQLKLASLTARDEPTEYSSMLPAVLVANLLVMFPGLRSMLVRRH